MEPYGKKAVREAVVIAFLTTLVAESISTAIKWGSYKINQKAEERKKAEAEERKKAEKKKSNAKRRSNPVSKKPADTREDIPGA